MGTDGLCDGCGRSIDEITEWLALSDGERLVVMQRVESWTPRREDRSGQQPAEGIGDR
jgi:predicted Fe-S protein YdhL (DUF1289 family)